MKYGNFKFVQINMKRLLYDEIEEFNSPSCIFMVLVLITRKAQMSLCNAQTHQSLCCSHR